MLTGVFAQRKSCKALRVPGASCSWNTGSCATCTYVVRSCRQTKLLLSMDKALPLPKPQSSQQAAREVVWVVQPLGTLGECSSETLGCPYLEEKPQVQKKNDQPAVHCACNLSMQKSASLPAQGHAESSHIFHHLPSSTMRRVTICLGVSILDWALLMGFLFSQPLPPNKSHCQSLAHMFSVRWPTSPALL